MRENIEILNNIPVTNSVLASYFPDITNLRVKMSVLEQQGILIRIKKGLYVVAPEISKKSISTELIANHIHTPSYISQLSALRYYGLIPEMVHITQSMTLKRSQSYQTPLGEFSYTQVSKESFPIGIRYEQNADYSFLIATPERALCDLIAHTSHLNLRYITEAATYLEDDIRIDMDAFYQMDKQIFQDYITVGKKTKSIQTILKLLEQ